jgi:hypothetical protein
MYRSNLIQVLVIAAALATAGRRWRVPYLQAAVRIVVGSLLLGYARGAVSWPQYLFAALGLTWIVLGASDIWRQRTMPGMEGS